MYLRIYCSNHPESWKQLLPTAEFAHNHRTHSAQKQSLFYLMMGYEPIALPVTYPKSDVPTAEKRIAALQHARDEALATHELARQLMAGWITRGFVPFKKGEKVWLEAKNLKTGFTTRKLTLRCEGPFIIKKVVTPLAYQLKLPAQWRIHPIFHATLLSWYQETDIHGPSYLPPPPDLIDGQEEHKVKALLSHKKRGRGYIFLIKWKGYPSSENSWEPEQNLSNAGDLLSEYKRLKEIWIPPHSTTFPNMTTPIAIIPAPFPEIYPQISSPIPITAEIKKTYKNLNSLTNRARLLNLLDSEYPDLSMTMDLFLINERTIAHHLDLRTRLVQELIRWNIAVPIQELKNQLVIWNPSPPPPTPATSAPTSNHLANRTIANIIPPTHPSRRNQDHQPHSSTEVINLTSPSPPVCHQIRNEHAYLAAMSTAKCHKCGWIGHYMSFCPNFQCRLCGLRGHYPSNCPNIPSSSNSDHYFTANDNYDDDFDDEAWANMTGEPMRQD